MRQSKQTPVTGCIAAIVAASCVIGSARGDTPTADLVGPELELVGAPLISVGAIEAASSVPFTLAMPTPPEGSLPAVIPVSAPGATTMNLLLGIGRQDYQGWHLMPLYDPGIPGQADDVITVDELPEDVRTYGNGTVPYVTEAVTRKCEWAHEVSFRIASHDGRDLFPRYTDGQGNVLTAAFFAIGLDPAPELAEPLLWPMSERVRAASLTLRKDGALYPQLPALPLDILDFFTRPPMGSEQEVPPGVWDGITVIILPDLSGAGIDEFELTITFDVVAPADFDEDVDIDSDDLAVFVSSMTVPSIGTGEGSTLRSVADLDFDGDVDMRDFAQFQPVCEAGTCWNGFIDDVGDTVRPVAKMLRDAWYIDLSRAFLPLMDQEITNILTELQDMRRLYIYAYDKTRVYTEFRYLRWTDEVVVTIEFFDGRPALRIASEANYEWIDVWTTSYTEKVRYYRYVGTEAAESLASFRRGTHFLSNVFTGIGAVRGLFSAADPCFTYANLVCIREMFRDAGGSYLLCVAPCQSLAQSLDTLFGWACGNWEGVLFLGLVYACEPICDVLWYSPEEVLDQHFWYLSDLLDAFRSLYGPCAGGPCW